MASESADSLASEPSAEAPLTSEVGDNELEALQPDEHGGETQATTPTTEALFPGADLPQAVTDAGEQPDGQVTADVDDLISDANAVDPKIDVGLLEAYLFSTHSPLTPGRLAELFNLESTKPIRKALRILNEQYESSGRCYRIEQVAGGFQMLTLPIYGDALNALHQREQDAKLTKAALETLSIIAYKQPILRADVEAIRGVASGETIRSLMEKHLVKIAGRAEEPGRPILYGTTKRFLEVFGLNSLKDLPQPDSPQAKQKELSRAAQALLAESDAAPHQTPAPPESATPSSETPSIPDQASPETTSTEVPSEPSAPQAQASDEGDSEGQPRPE